MNYKNISIVLLLCIMNNAHAKRTGQAATTQAAPIKENKPFALLFGVPFNPTTYTEILTILKSKKPNSSNVSDLNNIKREAEYQINLIQNNRPDLRAKRFNIKSTADIKTHHD